MSTKQHEHEAITSTIEEHFVDSEDPDAGTVEVMHCYCWCGYSWLEVGEENG